MRALLTVSLFAGFIGCGQPSTVEPPDQTRATITAPARTQPGAIGGWEILGFKARAQLRGVLSFESWEASFGGLTRGREAGSRKCIDGGPSSTQRAVWSFQELPSANTTSGAVSLVFAFETPDVAKGIENRGVDVNIRVVTWQCPQQPPVREGDGTWQWVGTRTNAEGKVVSDEQAYEERAKDLLFALDQKNHPDKRQYAGRAAIHDPKLSLARAKPGSPEWDLINELAREFGFYEIPTVEVFGLDHTETISIPVGLIENALANRAGSESRPPAHRVKVYVKCQTSGQALGMAESDLHFRGSD